MTQIIEKLVLFGGYVRFFLNFVLFFFPLALFSQQKLHVFIHVCTINHWESVLKEELERIYYSGLYNACESISLGVLGKGDIRPFITTYPKLSVLFQTEDLTQYERPTLMSLQQFCLANPSKDVLVLYLHTKGVSKIPPSANIRDWTSLMEYFLIDKWIDCTLALLDYDACGVNWQKSLPSGIHFFAGNFWWARADYIASLPKSIGPDYLDPELWLGLKSPNIKCLYESKVDHYTTPYPKSYYTK